MTEEKLLEGLQTAILAPVPLSQVVATLREYRHRGVARDEVQSALEGMRARARDEVAEDRILEVMDIVNGFCSPEMTVWQD